MLGRVDPPIDALAASLLRLGGRIVALDSELEAPQSGGVRRLSRRAESRGLLAARAEILAAAALFSTGGAAIKAAHLTSWQIAGFRSGVAAAVLLAARPSVLRRVTAGATAVALPYAATMILFVSANRLTTAASTIFLQSTAPLYVLLLGPWLLSEPVRRRDVGFLAVLAGGLGLFFVDREPRFPTAPDPFAGDVLAAFSGASWAFTAVGLRWLARSKSGPEDRSAASLLLGNVASFLACLPFALPLGTISASDWALVGYLGTSQIAAYLCLAAGLRRVPALEGSLLMLLEPVLNPVWVWLAEGERPGPYELVGGAVVLGATLRRVWREAVPPATT